MNLNKRQIQLILILVENKREPDYLPLSAKVLSRKVNVSTKTIYNDVAVIKEYINGFDVELIKKPRIGIYIQGSDKNLLKILTGIEFKKNDEYLDNETRRELVFSQLLNSDEFITIQDLSDKYYVNRQVILEDIDDIELRLKLLGLELQRRSGKGIKLDIDEDRRRKILTQVVSRQLFNAVPTINERNLKIINDNKLSISKNLITTVDSILSDFIKEQNMVLNDYEYQSLLVHLLIAVERIRLGKFINNNEHWGNSQIYLTESKILAKDLENALKVNFPKQEIYYIQLHLVAAGKKKANKISTNLNTNNLLQNYLNDFGYDDQLYEGLLLHISSSLNRWKLGVSITNPYKDSIIQKYNYAFEVAVHLKELYEQKYNTKINDDETAYLALHFEAYLERKRSNDNIVRTAIVCSTGLGTSQLLAARIKNDFTRVKVVKILSYDEYLKFDSEKIDLIISTIELPKNTKPTIYVSPVVSTEELKNKIKIAITTDKSPKDDYELFNSLISDKNIINANVDTWQDAIRVLGKLLEDNSILKDGSIESAIKRENLSFTSFKNISMPHANPKFVNKSQIGVLKLNNPIVWGDQMVSVVFFIAFKGDIQQKELDEIYDRFWDILSDDKLIKKIISDNDSKEISNLLKGR
ncbi:BglG family transcription antiterminator [Companilactobacillus kimchiensis]|uniref:PTS system, IIA component n=1 Tax=Companilactobacillus kimchiensis TaxID=993692 RepID=A0A0R2LIT4_9LACO|nr:BglG family transcription antiterminator [Companilactobacillus kimchiensis]KRN98775.1 PTS system, IIA component [Companilactobacillus kimchiensis]